MRARFPKLASALGDACFRSILASFFEQERDAARPARDAGRLLTEYLARCPEYPIWYAELALLDRAHVDLLQARVVAAMPRRLLSIDCALHLVPAHALVKLTTSSDELWRNIDPHRCEPNGGSGLGWRQPNELDYPRTVLMWRTGGMKIADRTLDPDEASALRAAARGTSLVELGAGLGGANAHARALDLVLRWIDEGVIAERAAGVARDR